jgi:hypothetical protein
MFTGLYESFTEESRSKGVSSSGYGAVADGTNRREIAREFLNRLLEGWPDIAPRATDRSQERAIRSALCDLRKRGLIKPVGKALSKHGWRTAYAVADRNAALALLARKDQR